MICLTSIAPDERPAAALASVEAGLEDLGAIKAAAEGCRACDLWARSTQTVFGEGPVPARLMLIGEEPGDREDVEGHPFVGPAGRILDEALEAAGIDRETVFVTNVVKHFKWRPAVGSNAASMSGRRRPRLVRVATTGDGAVLLCDKPAGDHLARHRRSPVRRERGVQGRARRHPRPLRHRPPARPDSDDATRLQRFLHRACRRPIVARAQARAGAPAPATPTVS